MELSNRMVKDFCEAMSMTKKEFPNLCETRNGGVRLSVRRNRDKSQPDGVIVTASTSLWLPLMHNIVFEFLIDDNRRGHWDVLSSGTTHIHQIGRISNGCHPSNCTRIIQVRIIYHASLII